MWHIQKLPAVVGGDCSVFVKCKLIIHTSQKHIAVPTLCLYSYELCWINLLYGGGSFYVFILFIL